MFVPSGGDTRPLVVAAHGAGGAPEWECDYWTRLTLGQAFVLCLRGTRINPRAGFYYRDHHALHAELTAALAAARQRFPRIAPSSGIYAGFSQGASMGALVVGQHAGELPYVVLIEGFQQWNVALGRAFAKQGGKAVLFACGTRECAKAADVSTEALERAGARARAEHAAGAGHTPGGRVEALVASRLPWLLDSDSAWLSSSTALPTSSTAYQSAPSAARAP
jgi:predicted esterase